MGARNRGGRRTDTRREDTTLTPEQRDWIKILIGGMNMAIAILIFLKVWA